MTTTPASRRLQYPFEIGLFPISQNTSINQLFGLCESGNRISEVNEFVRREFARLRTQGPSFIGDFLATQEGLVTSANAWTILGLFRKAYPSLRTDMSIERACQEFQGQTDQATFALKNALVLQNPQDFANLALQQTAEEIRNWLANPANHPLLQGVQELNLSGRGLSLVPKELRFLSNLQRLSLSQNQISEVDSETFRTLLHLNTLEIDENKIKAIDYQAFASLRNLRWLNLMGNQIPPSDSIDHSYLGLGQEVSLFLPAAPIHEAYLGLEEDILFF
jgi:hypothetical protein